MNLDTKITLHEYTLNLQSCGKSEERRLLPSINCTAKFMQVASDTFPEYISEEVFDSLVNKLKEELIVRGTLLPKAINPCPNCQHGYSSMRMNSDGESIIMDCHDNCPKLKEYFELLKKRSML